MAKEVANRCVLCGLRSKTPFCSLVATELERCTSQATVHVFKRGQTIFHTGAPPLALYIICSGRVKVFKIWHHGEEQVLRLLGPGDVLGYRPLFANEPYGASAESLGEATICILPRAVVHELVNTIPGVALQFLELMARELRVSEDLMMDLSHRPVRQRTARLLLELLPESQPGGAPGSIGSKELRRKDMARMIGTTPETLSRVLRALSAAGMIAVTTERIRIRDRAALERLGGQASQARN